MANTLSICRVLEWQKEEDSLVVPLIDYAGKVQYAPSIYQAKPIVIDLSSDTYPLVLRE